MTFKIGRDYPDLRGDGVQMDQTRVESFLDDGWSVIGQMHRWLSTWPASAYDRTILVELIQDLQSMWSAADDLLLKRLARTCLSLEQVLERFCARSLEFDSQRLSDVTAGIDAFQELLLGLEATREEPEIANHETLFRLERLSKQPLWKYTPPTVVASGETSQVTLNPAEIVADQAILVSIPTSFVDPVPNELSQVESPIQRTLLAMLEQFVAKLDDTCYRLHARVLTDESPYAATTSRLEHLAQSTRDLVARMIHAPYAGTHSANIEMATRLEEPTYVPLPQPAIEDSTPLKNPEDASIEAALPPALSEVSQPLAEVSEPETATVIENGADEVPQELAIAEFSSSPTEPEVIETVVKRHRVLIVEASLFYRHLIGMAVQSAGYESQSTESAGRAVDLLAQSQDFSAILVGSNISSSMADTISRCRRDHGIKVIRLTSANNESPDIAETDGQVAKSHPQQLIAILDQTLKGPSNQRRMSA